MPPEHTAAHDRRRAARHRAGDVRALRADPRLARRPRRRPRHAARDPGSRPAPAGRALAGDDAAGWLERRRAGDSIAQHGFQHERLRRGRHLAPGAAVARAAGARRSSSDSTATRRGARSTPAGACSSSPGSSPTASSRPPTPTRPRCAACCREQVPLVGGLLRVHRALAAARATRVDCSRPPGAWEPTAALQRTLSPPLIRAGSLALRATRCAWTCIRPTCEHPRHMIALEWVLGRAGRRREAITYDELLAARA